MHYCHWLSQDGLQCVYNTKYCGPKDRLSQLGGEKEEFHSTLKGSETTMFAHTSVPTTFHRTIHKI